MREVILKPSQHSLTRDRIAHEALRVLTRLDEAGYKGYLCGGGVRDLLLDREPKDFDIATDARPEEVKKIFRNCRIIGRRFKLAHIFFRDMIIETATFRALLDTPPPGAEDVPLPTRRATHVPDPKYATRDGVVVRDNVYGTPEEDARRRDFTINGLFYDIATDNILDYVGGLKDLDKRILRVIGEPETRFREDPVRMVRALRIASQLDFEIEESARDAIMKCCGDLQNSSRERLHEEMLKILNCGCAKVVFERSWKKGLFQTIYPSFSDWLQTPEGQEGLPWAKKALKQFDVWKKAGLKPMPALQFALLFGPYIEDLAARRAADGTPAFEAALEAVHAVLRDKANLTQIPKAVVFDVERILGIQVQMNKSSGQSKYAARLRHRKGFEQALIYLKFAAGVDPERKELLERWIQPMPEAESKPEESEKDSAPKKRRRSRRPRSSARRKNS